MVPTKLVVGTTLASEGIRRTSRKGCPNYPIDFKRRLAALACKPDVSVSKVALEHGLNTNLLFRWRRQYRSGCFGPCEPTTEAMSGSEDKTVKLLPVINADLVGKAKAKKRSVSVIEIVLPDATVRLCGDVDAAALRTVLDCLASVR